MKFCSLVGLGLACFYQCVARDCHYKKECRTFLQKLWYSLFDDILSTFPKRKLSLGRKYAG